MERLEGWEIKLDDFIKSRQNQKFQWGIQDCCLFACDAIREITGEDIADHFRGQYKTKDQAYLMLYAFSGGGLDEATKKIMEQFGMPEIKREFAGRGDVALCNVPTVINEELPTLGIIGMSEMIHIAGTRQIQLFEKTSGVKFWKV